MPKELKKKKKWSKEPSFSLLGPGKVKLIIKVKYKNDLERVYSPCC